jgi:TRAP-type C4-dicarboxylate transport system substrate-binding protein
VSGLGGIPVTMAFGDMIPAMQRGVIDCLITGTMSGNTAKVYEVGDTMFTLVVGWAPRVRIVNGNFWNGLDETQKKWMQKAADYLFIEMQEAIEVRNANEGIWCTTGDDRCTLDGKFGVKKANMTLVEPSQEDRALVRKAVIENVLPSFARSCGPKCTEQWNGSVGKVTGLTLVP